MCSDFTSTQRLIYDAAISDETKDHISWEKKYTALNRNSPETCKHPNLSSYLQKPETYEQRLKNYKFASNE